MEKRNFNIENFEICISSIFCFKIEHFKYWLIKKQKTANKNTTTNIVINILSLRNCIELIRTYITIVNLPGDRKRLVTTEKQKTKCFNYHCFPAQKIQI